MLTHRRARSAARQRDDDPMVGKTVHKRYKVTRQIARGGMATVYEAVDLRLQRTVALKVMHPGLGDPKEYAARFEREARAAARLAHNNVVGVHDFGNDRGTVYLAMELVPGRTTLRDLVNAESPMAPSRALSLIEPVVVALAAAHKAGIVHRDMKPENVLIDPSGAVKVADFGLARAISSTTQHTRTGVLIGTVSYVAPELVERGVCDARADVYAVGVMTFELLTGRKPHEGTNPIQVAYKHVNEDIAAPSSLVPSLPLVVDDLVASMTSRDPRERPVDASALLIQLRRVQKALANGATSRGTATSGFVPAEPVQPAPPVEPDAPSALKPSALEPASPAPGAPYDLDAVTDTASRGLAPVPAARPTAALPVRTAAGPSAAQRTPGAGLQRRRRRWRGPLVLLLALALASGVGAGAWWFGSGRYTTMPGVLNLKEAAATRQLTEAGFGVERTEVYTATDSDKGLVIDTDPAAGDRVLPGATVTLTISMGVEDYRLRDVSGWTLARATNYLDTIKMDLGDVNRVWSATVPKGEVIRTEPLPGQWLRPGHQVDLWVSKGPEPINFSSWQGRNGDQAEQTLTDKGLVVERTDEFSDDVAAGVVISMRPASGPLYAGDRVTLVVSKGPELFEVPSVRGKSLAEAEQILGDHGFKVKVEEHPLYVGWDRVISEDNAGDMLPKGSTVTIYIV